jgi:hypothetical protein
MVLVKFWEDMMGKSKKEWRRGSSTEYIQHGF